jgi:hypothetical protein
MNDDIRTNYKTIDDSSSLYWRMIELTPSSGTTRLVSSISSELFRDAVQKWDPHTLLDINPKNKLTIDMIFSPEGLYCTRELKDDVQATLLNTVTIRRGRFDANMATGLELHHVKALVDSSTLDAFEKFTTTVLPPSPMIQLKLNELDGLLDDRLELIRNELTMTVNNQEYTLARVVKEYNCIPTETLNSFISGTVTGFEMNSSKTKCEIESYFKELENLTKIFQLCAYFRQYTSLIFNNSMRTDGTPSDFGALIRFVTDAICKINKCFGSGICYCGVCTVMRVLKTEDLVNDELMVHLNCSHLNIESSNITNFRIIKLLLDFSKPLDEFVKYYVPYTLALNKVDDSFDLLQVEGYDVLLR